MQEGALCAQHCLNTLLQGCFFSAVDLAGIAKQLDEEELQTYAESGLSSKEYLERFKKDSRNMDDSGFFSIQVLTRALQIWNLELIPYMSTSASSVRQNPARNCRALICNYREHWFTIRQFANDQWFNLNSLNNKPTIISDTYLALYIDQLHRESYSIFVVMGELPQCEADEALLTQTDSQTNFNLESTSTKDYDWQMKAAIAASLQECDVAIELGGSSQKHPNPETNAPEVTHPKSGEALNNSTETRDLGVNREEIRQKREAFLNQLAFMGNVYSAYPPNQGYQVLRVHKESPAELAGFVPFYDFLVRIGSVELSSDKQCLKDLIKSYHDKPMTVTIYNSRQDIFRDVEVIPNENWGGIGLLGVNIIFRSFERAEENVWHVLDVSPNSPAAKAGLIPFSDYIIGSDSHIIDGVDLFELIAYSDGQPISFYVYNTVLDDCREVEVTPNSAWGGPGLVGCDLGFGYLHRVPRSQFTDESLSESSSLEPVETKMNLSKLSPIEKCNADQVLNPTESQYNLPYVNTSITLPGLPPLEVHVQPLIISTNGENAKSKSIQHL